MPTRYGPVPRPATDRFWAKVEKTDECWLWRGAVAGSYGRFYVGNRRLVQAHRWSYETLVGPIPDGLHLDHLCREQLCVNPAHLGPVTLRENTLRGLRGRLVTVCAQGHDYTPENTVTRRNGRRQCRTCTAAWEASRLPR